MRHPMDYTLLLLFASALGGCATTPSSPTYSGDVQAALQSKVDILKKAGTDAGTAIRAYVHNAVSSPMSEWSPSVGPGGVPVVDRSDSVPVRHMPAVSPRDHVAGGGLSAQEPGPKEGGPDVRLFAVVPAEDVEGVTLAPDSRGPAVTKGKPLTSSARGSPVPLDSVTLPRGLDRYH